MARPKKDKDLVFSHQITVRLSDVEYDLISTSAKDAGMTVSEYVRRATIDAKVVYNIEIVADMPKLMALTTEYSRIGNNLNQIAAFFNMGGIRSKAMQDEISKRLLELDDLKDKTLELAGDYRGNLETYRKQKRKLQ
ncbi:MAG: MobC family plasmid mobilization relaxosome protein [Lachnospiraceae bacterium]|nr:MobC family plasmid mobilization relaxosome protein [Lachnospiraceae bacterium]